MIIYLSCNPQFDVSDTFRVLEAFAFGGLCLHEPKTNKCCDTETYKPDCTPIYDGLMNCGTQTSPIRPQSKFAWSCVSLSVWATWEYFGLHVLSRSKSDTIRCLEYCLVVQCDWAWVGSLINWMRTMLLGRRSKIFGCRIFWSTKLTLVVFKTPKTKKQKHPLTWRFHGYSLISISRHITPTSSASGDEKLQ